LHNIILETTWNYDRIIWTVVTLFVLTIQLIIVDRPTKLLCCCTMCL